jgi:hypothetical protein
MTRINPQTKKVMKLNIKNTLMIVAVSCFAFGSYAVAGGKGTGASHSAGHGNSAFGLTQGSTQSANHGNSAFGIRQADSSTRTTGQQNSNFGKAKAAAHSGR